MPVLLLVAVDTLLDWMFDFKIKQPKDSMILQCRTYSMSKILTHECLAAGCLNKGYSSAGSTLAVWESILTNSEEALSLLACRMESDYLALAPKMRRAYKQADVESCMSSQ